MPCQSFRVVSILVLPPHLPTHSCFTCCSATGTCAHAQITESKPHPDFDPPLDSPPRERKNAGSRARGVHAVGEIFAKNGAHKKKLKSFCVAPKKPTLKFRPASTPHRAAPPRAPPRSPTQPLRKVRWRRRPIVNPPPAAAPQSAPKTTVSPPSHPTSHQPSHQL